MNDPSNRTIVCSVLFFDIAEYSRRSVAEQMRQKQKFNALLEQALKNVALNDRIVLDTGDGAAVSFLGNPDEALYVAMSLRNAIAEDQDPSPLLVRTGVNLGPVRLIKDLNGQLNMIGDGINVAERVMSFSHPGQILVSRSYYEVVYRLDPLFEKLFKYEGARTDKHVREHEVYAVGAGPAPLPARAESPEEHPRAGTPRSAPRRVNVRLAVALPTLMVLIIAGGVAVRASRPGLSIEPPELPSTAVSRAPPAERKAALRSDSAVPAEQKAPAWRKSVEREAAPILEHGDAAARLVIVPWGEVFVDGNRRGVSPPLRILSLSPGPHKVEIRNGELPAHVEQVAAQPGEKLTIRHRFN